MGDLFLRESLIPFMKVAEIGREGQTIDIFHHNVGMAFMGVEIKDLNNIGMP